MRPKMSAVLSKINKLFVGNKIDIDQYDKIEFDDHVAESGNLSELVIDHMFGPDSTTGNFLPWDGLDHTIRFRPNELTVWNGINGHGKSSLANQVIFGFLKQGCKCLIASLEMRPQETIARMICQAYAIKREQITKKAVNDFFPLIEDQLYLYKETGDMESNRVHALCRWAKAELDIEHIVIDSMMKCGVREGDNAQEKDFVNALQNIAKQTGLHIHLITHAKKGIDETKRPGKFDVHGSAHITNLPDNVIIMARNKKKEVEIHKPSKDQSEKILLQPDVWMEVAKQRHGTGWEGLIGLYWHESKQYAKKEGGHRSML